MKEELGELQALFGDDSPTEVLDRKSPRYQKLATMHGISIFYYEKGILKYWSDHSIPLPNRWRARFARSYVSLRNSDYVSVVSHTNEGVLVGLIEIKTHFPFENEFLNNGYQRDFSLDAGVQIEILEANGSEPIYNDEGVYLFSLDFSEAESANNGLKAAAESSFLLFVFFVFAGFYRIVKGSNGTRKWVWIGAITFIVAGCVFAVQNYSFPSLFTGSELFQPELFASRIFPSLGSLLVITMATLSLAALYYLHGNLERIRSERGKHGLAILLFSGASVLLLFTEHLISILILDSSISFEAHRVTTFSGYTVVGLSVIIMWFLLLCLILDKAIVLSGQPARSLLYGSMTVIRDHVGSYTDPRTLWFLDQSGLP